MYYSISSGLTKNEMLKIDNQVFKNLQRINLFVRNLTSNSKLKAKKLFLHGMVLFELGQALVPCTAAVVMPIPPVLLQLKSSRK